MYDDRLAKCKGKEGMELSWGLEKKWEQGESHQEYEAKREMKVK